LGPREAETLRAALLEAVRDNRRTLRLTKSDSFGRHYILDFEMATTAGTANVRSSWILLSGEDTLRFVTCYLR
jgi:hypothetical protein